MTRFLRMAVAAAALFAPFAASFTAMAQSCTALDPTCTVGDTVGTAQQTAGDTANKAKDGIAAVTSTVGDTIDRLVHHGGNPPPSAGSGSDRPTGGGHRPPGGHPAGKESGRPAVVEPATSTRAGSPASASVLASSSAPSPSPMADRSGSSPSRITRIAGEVLGGAVVMAFLLAAIALFLMVQDRLDRRDPKLLQVSLGPDLVRFR